MPPDDTGSPEEQDQGFPAATFRRMLQLWPERTLRQRLPPTKEDARPLEKTVQSSRSTYEKMETRSPEEELVGNDGPKE